MKIGVITLSQLLQLAQNAVLKPQPVMIVAKQRHVKSLLILHFTFITIQLQPLQPAHNLDRRLSHANVVIQRLKKSLQQVTTTTV